MIMAIGVGTIDLNLKVGQRIAEAYLDEVLYVPELHGNLFSVNKTVKLGNKATFDQKDCIITSKSGNTIAVATRVRDLYQLNTIVPLKQAKLASHTGDPNLWHRRFGHLSLDGMKLANDMVEGMNLDSKPELDLCAACIHGKQHRSPMPV